MFKTRYLLPCFALLLLLSPCPAPACSLCNGLQVKFTLRQDMEQSQVILFGTLANPRLLTDKNVPPGTGVTDFHIDKVLRGHPALGDRKSLELPRYIPVLEPKNPPRQLLFCEVQGEKIDVKRGRFVGSQAVLDYLDGIKALGKDRTGALIFFSRYLDHADPLIAEDAFLEFARSSDLEVGQVARHLSPQKLRGLLEDPMTPPVALSLYAFLLGGCGGDQEAELLRSWIEKPAGRFADALDGLLSGYIHLRPRQGWDLALKILGDAKRQFNERYAVVRTLRFYHGWKPAESRAVILRGYESLVEDGEMADLPVDDLRQWKVWDLTGKILAQYGKQSHSAPIVSRAIVRYALSCPLPEARRFVEAVRRQDGDLVQEIQKSLEPESN